VFVYAGSVAMVFPLCECAVHVMRCSWDSLPLNRMSPEGSFEARNTLPHAVTSRKPSLEIQTFPQNA
jgi:hypothetical protein